MKDFFKFTLASMLGMFLFTILVTILSIIGIAGMVASENLGAPVEKNSILRINLNGAIEEQSQANPMAMFNGGESETVGLDNLLLAIQKAKGNDKVKGIYIEGGMPAATPATLQEVRQALLDFKKSGKFIYAYADTYTQGGYYICSVADSVMVNPQGGIDWHGLASEPMFFKDALAKVGVKMQVFKVGTYKSAVEPFTSTEMSEANREQVTSYLGSIWGHMLKEIAASRKLKEAELNAYADSFLMFQPTENLIKWHVADKLTYIDEVKASLKQKMELDDDDELRFVSITDMALSEDPDKVDSDDEIAVYYAYGDIVNEASNSLTSGGSHSIIGTKVVNDLRELREDKNIKAVVIRVNSGGGSAYASEQIWREVELLKAEKPVVISMGGMAASGGYYISCGANKIYAEPTTITGSIGIFGMIPDMSELITQKVGVKFDVVKTNALSDFGSMSRPMNAEEGRLMQAQIERGYETFTGRVAMGRKLPNDSVKAIAEGRVWTGEQALKIGLVDKLGNLNDAIKCAAKLAELKEYTTSNHPAAEPWYANLLNNKKDNYLESQLRATLGEYYTTFSLLHTLKAQDRIQMRIPFEPNIH